MMNGEGEIHDWQLERYLLGELPDGMKERIEKRIETDASVRRRLDALRASNREILSSYPPELMTGRIAKRYRERYGKLRRRTHNRPALRRAVLALSLAAAVTAVVLPLRTLLQEGGESGSEQGIRPKGLQTRLVVYRKAEGGIERLENGALAGEGDVIQLSYVTGPGTYGVIYSLDDRGTVTLHFPERVQERAPELQSGGEVSLPYAYQLDDAPSFERFFFVTSDHEFLLLTAEKAVRTLASNPAKSQKSPLELPSGFDQYSVLLKKQEMHP
jgi:hypothetical protein